MLVLVLVLPPQRSLGRLLLLLSLLLEPIVLQPHRTEIPTLPCSLPVAAVPDDAHRCHSEFLAAAVAPVAADIAADPVHAAPPAAKSLPAASAAAAHRRHHSRL